MVVWLQFGGIHRITSPLTALILLPDGIPSYIRLGLFVYHQAESLRDIYTRPARVTDFLL